MKWVDRRRAAPPDDAGAAGGESSPAHASARLAAFLDRFFPGASDERVPALLAERFPETCKHVFEMAERVCENRFDLLGEHGLWFGSPVDWHLDPTTGRRAPRRHWSRIDPLDVDRVGDVKIVWELNRHQWLVALAQAYYLSHDERYAERAVSALASWRSDNPPGVGINWASSLEVSLRIVSWTWTLVLLRDSEVLAGRPLATALRWIGLHAAHVERYLSRYTSPNTHLTGEALGLVYAGLLLDGTPAAKRWLDTGAEILREELPRQVHPDGVYFEQATAYQRYTAEIYLHFLGLAGRCEIPEGEETRARLGRLLDFLLSIQHADGTLPPIGDADGGTLLPLAPRGSYDARGVFGAASVLLDRPDFAWGSRGPTPEALWMWGGDALDSEIGEPPAPPQSSPSQLFGDGGYAVLRSDWTERSHCVVLDCGPLGASPHGGHGHADLLSLQCAVFGEQYVVDPGTYRYAAAPDWRDAMRCTRAHSTILVDSAPQAVPEGPFAWRSVPLARLREWQSNAKIDLIDAEHTAYTRLRDPVRHRRRVVFVKPRYWVVVDDLYGAAEHHFELRFQLGEVQCDLRGDGWAIASRAGTTGLLVRPFASIALRAEIRRGSLAPIEGWLAPDYGQRVPAPALVYSATTVLPARIVTLLLPVRDAGATPPDVTAVGPDTPGPVGLAFREARELVAVEEDGVRLFRAGDDG